ncbi:MAG: hypothetical protein AB7F31_04010 [Parachlamydiales bacterium]
MALLLELGLPAVPFLPFAGGVTSNDKFLQSIGKLAILTMVGIIGYRAYQYNYDLPNLKRISDMQFPFVGRLFEGMGIPATS